MNNKIGDIFDKIPVISLEQMAKNEYDVLIVGTGAGGGAVLWRLCEQWRRNGKRIGVIEAGDLLLPTNARNMPTIKNWRTYFDKISYPIGKFLPQFSGATQVFALGGKTLFWGAVSPRLHRSELKEWPINMNDLKIYYNIAEQFMHVTRSFTKKLSIMQTILNRLRDRGFPEATHMPLAVEFDQNKHSKIRFTRLFSSISFLTASLNHRPFDLAVKAHAVQVLIENKKAVGVKVVSRQKRAYFLKARTVVLSTGCLETPRLLLNSGIKGDAIGHYLVNHSSVRGKGKLYNNRSPMDSGRIDILLPQTKNKPFQIQIHREKRKISLTGYGKVESRFDNKLTLNSRRLDEYGVPQIQVQFSYSEKDKEIIRQMVSTVKKASSAMGAVLTSKNGQPTIDLRTPGAEHHESGTCRMGKNPSTSATNRYGEIHFISGLYVADNSVLPSIGATNPTLTTIALAIRTADHIIHQLNLK